MDQLRDWRFSVFEKEGAFVAGLRSGFCLQGHPWIVAQSEATALVNEALRLMGAARPTWDEGQRDYVDPRDTCRWCRGAIPAEFLVGRRNGGFCSAHCAQTAILRRNLGHVRDEARAYMDAREVVIRSRYPARECVECGKSFRPLEPDGKFCSSACMGKSWTTRPLRQCVHCGASFRASTEDNKGHFCSAECYRRHGRTTRYERKCAACGTSFVTKLSHGRCCSNRCAGFLSRVRAGHSPPKRINPQVFDYMFIVGGNLGCCRAA